MLSVVIGLRYSPYWGCWFWLCVAAAGDEGVSTVHSGHPMRLSFREMQLAAATSHLLAELFIAQ